MACYKKSPATHKKGSALKIFDFYIGAAPTCTQRVSAGFAAVQHSTAVRAWGGLIIIFMIKNLIGSHIFI